MVEYGGTHNFSHSKDYFIKYHKVEIKDVQYSSGISKIVGLGTVILPIVGGVQVEAYHPPEFEVNILSVAQLSNL